MADKYTDDDRKKMAASGQAMKDGSYPIKDEEDLSNAIHAVGRGGADHDAIRKHIMSRAKALAKSSMIPDNWNPDGSLKGSAAAQHDPAFLLRKRRRGSMAGQFERRRQSFTACQFDLRAKPDGTGGSMYELDCYGSTFDDPFQMWDMWGDEYEEIVRPGAFTQTLARPDLDTPLLLGHNDMGIPFARTSNGKMHLAEDSRGLHVNAQRLNGARSDVRDMVAAVEDGDLNEVSIGFVTLPGGHRWSEDVMTREMLNLDLHRGDVSLVALAANPATKGATMAAMPGVSGWGASWQPAAERRIQAEIEDLSTRPDFNLPSYDPAGHGPGSIKCPNDACPVYAGGDGQRALNDKDAKCCDQCGAPLYNSDGTLVLDDSGVVESVNGAMADSNLLARRLRLLELA